MPHSAEPAGRRRTRLAADRPWLMLLTACLAVFAALGLGRFGYSAVLPSMQEGLDLTNTQAGGLASWNLAAYVLVAVAAGALSARVGARRLVPIGLVVAGVAMLGTGLASGFGSASVARAFTGAGAGMINVPVVALTATWFTARRRGLASGIIVSGSSVALVLVGPTVPRVLDAFGEDGWRLCWFAFGGAALAIAVVAALFLRDHPSGGQAIEPAPSTRTGIARVVRSGYAWQMGAVYFAFGFSYVIYLTFFVKRLTGDLGLSPEAAGTLFMILGWASLFCGIIWGAISDRIGRKHALVAVSLIHAVAFLMFAVWTGTAALTTSAVLFGFTAWSVPGIVGAACGDAFGPSLTGAALGFVTLFLGVGQAVGPLVGGALADAYATFVPAYLLAASVALAGGIGAVFLPVVRAPGLSLHAHVHVPDGANDE